ncbi:Holliday junction ATP-dependent DNA helicase RuvA [Polystyrenella longa]|uniref:Holliday junction branch migration complex subunit RuvA n=1 Tax=Polystyrenella longa TaxID=2528007 RepID=A0A518CK18_9PLAN|nr:Holliday junction branch migration protein RuvA [Polystyrenella longa]QDU79571.1 Holliday junction ATP-dependent DNA helicase RuvA [Polystyrenella longa]
MITRIQGELVHLSDTVATLRIGAFDYEVLIPEFVRRHLQSKVGTEINLRTIEYLEGNPQQGRLVPRMIGFMSDAEKEFFEMICSVDGVGVRKALRAMVRPVREVATAIEEQDVKQLTTLPGVGPAVAERIVAKLRRKMTKFALMVSREWPEEAGGDDILGEAVEALISLGHTSNDARNKVEAIMESGKKFKSVEALLTEIYKQQR